jgi:predicted glycosyltransferase
MKTLMWCQHSIGVGHLARALQIGRTLSLDGRVDLICGGAVPSQFNATAGIKLHQLIPLHMGADGQLMSSASQPCDQATLLSRQQQVMAIAALTVPDVLIIEMFPFGRKKLADEVIALIDFVRHRFGTRIVCSLRDVLVTTRRDQARFDLVAIRRLNKLFDLLLIHGDPSVMRLEDSLASFDAINIPWQYTGYIARERSLTESQREQRIVVSAGGGRVGQSLLSTAAACAIRFREELGLDTVLITGPNGSAEGLQPNQPGLSVIRFVDDLPRLLTASSVSISQCGYNTVTDILGAGIASVVVPYETAGENEQLSRGNSLHRRGWVVMLRTGELNPANLFDAVKQALSSRSNNDRQQPIVALDGLVHTRRLIGELVSHA